MFLGISARPVSVKVFPSRISKNDEQSSTELIIGESITPAENKIEQINQHDSGECIRNIQYVHCRAIWSFYNIVSIAFFYLLCCMLQWTTISISRSVMNNILWNGELNLQLSYISSLISSSRVQLYSPNTILWYYPFIYNNTKISATDPNSNHCKIKRQLGRINKRYNIKIKIGLPSSSSTACGRGTNTGSPAM